MSANDRDRRGGVTEVTETAGETTSGPSAPPSSSSPSEAEEALSCLLEAMQDLNAADELGLGLRRVAARLKRYVNYDNLGILLLDPLGRELRFELAVGYPPDVAEHWRFGLGQGLIGTAAKSREAILVGDVRGDPRYINAAEGTRSELAVPLVAKGRTIGVVDVGSTEPNRFGEDQKRLLIFLAGHLANAIENARLYQNMRQQARTLSLLHEVSHELTSILDLRELLERVAELVKRLIDYDQFGLLLWEPSSQALEPWLTIGADGREIDGREPAALGYGISGTAAALRLPVRVPNVHLDPRYVRGRDDPDVKSEMAVPLVFKDRLIGVLDLESVEYDAFGEGDEQLLATLASSIAIALENARLYQRLQREESRLAADLKTARQIQKELLPKATPWIPGLQVAVTFRPARHLAGDFYDFLPYGDGRVGFAVGDVAGKATPAALYGFLAAGMLREYAVQNRFAPARTLGDMNEKLLQLGVENRFLAMVFAVYDADSKVLILGNSGLPRPRLLRRGRVQEISAVGVPLGLLPDQKYEEVELELRPGDAVVICSDGVEESADDQGSEFGRAGVDAALERRSGASAEELAAGLLEDSERFAGGQESADDRTILVLRVAQS